MADTERTTARARRQQAVDSGARSDGVDRVSDRSNPGGQGRETTTRKRQNRLAREVAGDIDIEREGVGTVDRIGGMDVFLRSPGVEQFGADVASDFASGADFVEAGDVNPQVDGDDISATPQVAQDRRDDVAERARSETAADTEFVTASDLDAEVGARGVTGIEVAADRRDDVAARTRQQLASNDPFAQPDDFAADVSASGVESAGLTDQGARRRAGRQFEDEYDVFGSGELDPQSDIRAIDDGFGLAREEAKEAAAASLDAQYPDIGIGTGDVELTQTDSGAFSASFEREVSR